MTVEQVFELRRQGRVEEAYDAIRSIYAADKGPQASKAMFWTATDILRKRLTENREDEARKIFLALKRMLPQVPDENGWADEALRKCEKILRSARFDVPAQASEHLETGIWGEELASAFLREKGYVILERDWHSGHRDIDIIAQKDDCIVFVEVKTRSNDQFMAPELAVNYKKQLNLRAAINHYIKYRRIEDPVRFDVITIVGTPDSMPTISHIEDFQLALPRR